MYIEPMNERYYMIMILVPLLAINMIRNLKLLVPFSQVANVVTFAGLGIVCWYIFTDLPPISSRPLIGNPRNYMLFMGTTLFALEAFGVVSLLNVIPFGSEARVEKQTLNCFLVFSENNNFLMRCENIQNINHVQTGLANN